MNIETCYKYVMFLIAECDRYLGDEEITDEEMHSLKIEFDAFIEQTNNSNLPIELKNKINALELDYTYQARREYGPLLGRFNFGSRRRRADQKQQIEEMKFQMKGLPMFMKMNFNF